MKKQTLFSVLPVSFLLSSTSALAAMDAQTFATALYESQKKSLTAQGATVTETGTLTVTPQGNYYTVAYPALTIKDNDAKIDIGSIRLNLMPDANGKEWKMTLAIPSPIKMSKQDGTDSVIFSIGKQNLSAVVDEATLFPRMVDAAYQDLRLTSLSDNTVMTFDRLSLTMNYTPDTAGLLSGPFAFEIANMAFEEKQTEPPQTEQFKIGSLSAKGDIRQMDMAMVHAYNKKMSELTDAGLDPDKIDSAQSMSALWKILMDDGLQQMDGMKATLALKDIEFSKPDHKTPGTLEQVNLGEISYRFDTSGLRGETSNSDFGFSLSGLSMSGFPVEFSKFFPQTINLSFGYKNLPHKALMQQLGTLAQSGAGMHPAGKNGQPPAAAQTQGPDTQMMAMQAMMTVPGLLAKAGTIFTINNTEIKTSDYGVTMNGEFRATSEALYGGTGSTKTVFTGLDQLITDLQAMTQDPKTKPDLLEKVVQAVQGLSAIQLFGQQGTDASGKPARIYDVTLDAQGGIKLNGSDLSTMMGTGTSDKKGNDAPLPAK